MSTAQQLLAEIEQFIERHDMRPTAFGVAAVNDGHLIRDLRAGRNITASKIDRVRSYMTEFQSPRCGRGAAA